MDLSNIKRRRQRSGRTIATAALESSWTCSKLLPMLALREADWSVGRIGSTFFISLFRCFANNAKVVTDFAMPRMAGRNKVSKSSAIDFKRDAGDDDAEPAAVAAPPWLLPSAASVIT